MMQDVERVAKAIHDVKGGLNYDYMDFCRDAATAAISAMTPDTDAIDWIDVATALHAGEDVGYVRGWNAAIEAAKWAVVGYIHPDHGRLPGEAFASAQIDKLKKPTGN